MTMKAARILIYVLAISVLFSACKTSKRMQRKAQKEQTEVVKPEEIVVPIPEKPKPSYSYNWVSYRGPAEIVFDGKKYQCNYYMVNCIDSVLYLNLSLNFLGIEVARLVATPKEVIFVNKLTSEYYRGDYSFVEKYLKTKADFYTLQAIFNGDEAKLKAYNDFSFYYHPYTSEQRPFFDSFSISMNGGQRKVDAQVKNLKFNTPGTTSIRIPEGFKEMKL